MMRCSSHISFNSLSQYERFYPMTKSAGHAISCGVRINPEYSEIETELYNPCAPGSRFGVTADLLPADLPVGIEGSIVIATASPILMLLNTPCNTLRRNSVRGCPK